ncbi:glycosyltransferase family 39 protein [Geminocystis sp. NIES-3709]|uniref:ArnT family glycosyltransferase n=1 Tax=Geminocystis sp. NIES-3709 TaxID=1617448 RepID=UPI0005FC9AD4|nr:glycosyltransferase family 39 protein [Geminocystis sp. NIES-3709]BAQ63786.1 4-amino-4-deoxy-L-arabinose transferase and related glycosyltransferases of PMT family [Geminocystis sp. NIES-3709]
MREKKLQINSESLQKSPEKLWAISIVSLSIICGVAFFLNIGNIGLIDKTEALYVEVARQMVITNNWISPHWNDNYFYSYPAGGYWFLALSFKLFGISEFSARLPIALTATAVVFMVFYTLRYFGYIENKPKNPLYLWLTAWIGGSIMALNPAWIAWGRVAVSDMLLSSAVSLAMLTFFLGYAQPDKPKTQRIFYSIFPILLSIAVLVKGPIGIILPVLGIGIFLLYVGKFWEIFWEIKTFRTIGIFLILTLPWYIAAIIMDGEIFVNEFLAVSNFKRFTSVVFNHPGPWYYYIIWGTVLMLPWIVYFPLAVMNLSCWRWQKVRQSPRQSQLGLYAFCWFITTFVFFSAAATKLQGYILPVTPAVVIIIALFWGEKLRESSPKNEKLFLVSAIFNLIILLALSIASAISVSLIGEDTSAPTFAENLGKSGIPIISAISWGLGVVTAIALLWKKPLWRWFWSSNLLAFFAFVTFVFPPLIPLLDIERQQSFRAISLQIKEEIKPQEEVFLIGFTRYSIVYYADHSVNFVHGIEDFQDQIKQKNLQGKTILVVVESKYLEDSPLGKMDYDLVSQKQAYKLIRIARDNIL